MGDADILVTIPNGKLRGRKESSKRGISFYAFQQIPYAKPPVGELRWREPLPPDNWDGILDATRNDKSPMQICPFLPDVSNYETEDCLYLNVYTPKYPSTNLSLPVMYHMHGGGFYCGAANFDYAGPHYLMESEVIVVTVSYRLGVFGFLSTADKVIPGNYGLKDQQMGLKWVQKNIKYFGGDPNKVTIFGQSGGGISVIYQMLSEGSKGLFRAGIGQSVPHVNSWAFQRSCKKLAFEIGAALGKNFNEDTDSDKLLAFLRTIPAKQLNTVATQIHKDNFFIGQTSDTVAFTPVIEPEHETAFITENIYEAIENGRMARVPLMIGMCSEEQLIKLLDDNFPSVLQNYDNDVTLFVDKNIHITDRSKYKEIGRSIHDLYVKGRMQDDKAAAVRYFTDVTYTFPLIHLAELLSNFSDVYFFEFSYFGKLGYNTGPFIDGAGKVRHGDDVHYIWAYFNSSTLNNYSEDDILTSDRYRTLFTNFAKYLNPTPEKMSLLQNLIWPKVTPNNFKYLNIDKNLSIQDNFRRELYQKWVKIYKENAVKPNYTS